MERTNKKKQEQRTKTNKNHTKTENSNILLNKNCTEKAGARKWTSLVRFQPQLFAGQISFNLKQTFQQLSDNEGLKRDQNWTPQLLISSGSTF